MKAVYALAVAGLSLVGAMGAVSAQSYGERDYGYRNRDDGYRDRSRGGYDDRDRGYGDRRDRDYGERDYGDRGGRSRGGYGFDEAEYLRCNPDVLRAVRNGQVTSGAAHYKVFGRREGRKLSC